MATPAPPRLPDERAAAWEPAAEEAGPSVDAPGLSVRTALGVYEDRELRERVAAESGVDEPWRVLVTVRVAFDPVPGSIDGEPVRGLVHSNARSAFVDRLRERGFDGVRRRGRPRRRTVDGVELATFRYAAERTVGDRRLPVEGWLAIRTRGAEYLVGGTVFPVDVGRIPDVAAVRSLFDEPDAYRDDLFSLVAAME